MNNLYGILRSPNCLTMLNSDNFVAYPSLKSNKEPSIFTAKHFLEYCRLIVGPKVPEKAVGLSLVRVIANEPRFKDGIIRRCELALRIKLKGLKSKPNALDLSQKEDVNLVKCDTSAPFLHLNLENKSSKECLALSYAAIEMMHKSTPLDSEPPMVVNDIKSFALLDAKFRKDKERNFLNESIVIQTEEFIREIKPTFSDFINKQECEEKKNVACDLTSKISEKLNQERHVELVMYPRPTKSEETDAAPDQEKGTDKKPELSKERVSETLNEERPTEVIMYPRFTKSEKSDTAPDQEKDVDIKPEHSEEKTSENLIEERPTEVIMYPRPSKSEKGDTASEQEKFIDKKKVISKVKLARKQKEMKRRERGWRIRESFDIYKDNLMKRSSSRLSRPSVCASEVAAPTRVSSNHPVVKAVTSTWDLPDVQNMSPETTRRYKAAEERIQASFKTFVERQNQGRIIRALREQ